MKDRPPRRSFAVFGRRLGPGVIRPLGEGAAFGRYGVSFVALVVVVAGASIHAAGRAIAFLPFVLAALLAVSAGRARSKVIARVDAGAAVAMASLAAAFDVRWFAVTAAIGIWASASAALDAIAEIDAPACIASKRMRPWRPWRIAFGVACALVLAVLVRDHAPSAVVGIAITSILLLGFASFYAGVARRLELGVPEKTRVGMVMAIIGTALAVIWTLADRLAILPAFLTVSLVLSLATARILALPDPAKIAVRARLLVALSFAGAPVVVLAFIGADNRSTGLVVVCVVLALVIGALGQTLAGSLRPDNGAWLDAVAAARAAMKHGGPDDALRAALIALRAPVKESRAGAELLLLDPQRAIGCDAAGYMRTRDEAVPVQLLDVALAEPESTLRAELLDELEVRRPDLRALGRWMTDRGALAATVVANGDETIAILVLPRGARKDPLSLEEVRAFKDLADDFSGVCVTRAALARGLARQVEAACRVDAAEEKQRRLEHALEVEGARHALATVRLARPAAVGVYSAGSRLALDELERRAATDVPLVLFAPPGTNPVPLVARAHLSSRRAKGPFVVVECTSSREHDVARWRDRTTSPLVLAHGGLLLLGDGAALPRDVQQAIGEALAERRSPSGSAEPLDVRLGLTTARELGPLLESGELDALLASRFGAELTRPVRLPRIDERAEDLRAIVTDLLAREGVRARGDAVGIEDRAFLELVEYPFPGGDAELLSIVRRLVASVGRDGVARLEDVAALGLERPAEEPEKNAGAPKIRLV